MNIYAIPPLLTGLILAIISLLVFLKNKTSKLNIIFSLFSLSMVAWLFGYTNVYLSKDPSIALKWARIGFLGIIFIPIFAYHFIVSFLNLKRKILLPIIYLLAIPAVLLSQTNYIYSGIKEHFWGYYPTAGKIYILFLLMFGVLFTKGVWLLFTHLKKETGVKKEQIKYVCLAFGIGTFGIVDYLIKYPIFDIYPFGYICALLFISLIAFAITRYHLMDINVAITRTGIFAVVYALVLGLPFVVIKWLKPVLMSLLGEHWWLAVLVFGMSLASAGPFIYIYLRRQAEARLLAEDLKRYETLKRFARTLGLIRDLDELVKLIVYRLVKTLRLSYGAIYLFDDEEGAYILKSTYSLKLSKPSLLASISKDGDFIKFIQKFQKEFLYEDVQRLAQEKPNNKNNPDQNNQIDFYNVASQLKQFNASLVIPHFLENDLVGFLILGEKLSGRAYSEADIDVLVALSRPAGLAILNAISIIDLKKTEFELAEASRVAQIGYLASATGHQLSNVLNNIAAIASDLLEDESVLNSLKDKPQVYSVIEKRIKNIFTNVEDGGLIIREIRDYAQRDEEKKFTLLDLSEVIDKTLKILYIPVNKFQTVDFKVNISPDIPKILGSHVQLQNVLMNMCNNCFDTILEKRTYIKAHPELGITDYKGRIQINIAKVKNKVSIHIFDDGMGLPQDVQKRLFTPLYTTKASSIKRQEKKVTGGTGIGLYTILLIIKNHGGSIRLYKTEFLKGADFLIELPIPQEDNSHAMEA